MGERELERVGRSDRRDAGHGAKRVDRVDPVDEVDVDGEGVGFWRGGNWTLMRLRKLLKS